MSAKRLQLEARKKEHHLIPRLLNREESALRIRFALASCKALKMQAEEKARELLALRGIYP